MNFKIYSSIFSIKLLNNLYMSDSERIKRLEEYTGLSLNKLAATIGIKSPQTFMI